MVLNMFMVFVNKLNVIVDKYRKMYISDELLPFLVENKENKGRGKQQKSADYPEDNQHLAEPLTRIQPVNLRVTNALLYQLSYSGNCFCLRACKITALF